MSAGFCSLAGGRARRMRFGGLQSRGPAVDAKTKARFEARAKVVKAMAHPTRLFIVDELSRGERCVCELTEMVGADTSTVSKHLSVLRHAGIVEDDKRGANVYYSLRVPCVMKFFGCVESVLEARVEAQREAL
jgi:ArsR family transcriptional regulator